MHKHTRTYKQGPAQCPSVAHNITHTLSHNRERFFCVVFFFLMWLGSGSFAFSSWALTLLETFLSHIHSLYFFSLMSKLFLSKKLFDIRWREQLPSDDSDFIGGTLTLWLFFFAWRAEIETLILRLCKGIGICGPMHVRVCMCARLFVLWWNRRVSFQPQLNSCRTLQRNHVTRNNRYSQLWRVSQ